MKKILMNICVLCTVLFVGVSCEKEEVITVEGLPSNGASFLNEHFSGVKVGHVKKEKEGLSGLEYKVYLENSTTVTFDKNGDWIEVDAEDGKAIPTSFIPSKIVSYLQENYADASINSIEKESRRYEVGLTNGWDLEFNLNGDFVRMD